MAEMKSFLQYVAEDIISKHGTNLSDVVVVFPNKRASLFMNEHLLKTAGRPIWSPRYITISELFRSKSDLTVVDPIKAICLLYDIYCRNTGSTESLDKFWSWGEVILSDFDDIDKNLGDASSIYNNVRDLHAFDSVEFLDDEKREVLKKFFSEFTDDHESRLKQNFERLWNKLSFIYTDFKKALNEQGLAYEGQLYREVCNHLEDIEWEHSKYIFVGFNMIQKVEQQLFSSLKSKGLAHFYWDFDLKYLDNDHEAGLFINRWLVKFPNELDIKDTDIYGGFSQPKDITYMSASTENIQARYISKWLKQNNRIKPGERTAIVLSDESLLKSVIHYLPEEMSHKTNITVGYPLSQSPVTAFVKDFVALHIYGYNAVQKVYMSKQASTILRHPYTHLLSESAKSLPEQFSKERIFFPSCEHLCIDEGLTSLFTPIDTDEENFNPAIIHRLQQLLKTIGENCEKQRIARILNDGGDSDSTPGTYEEQFLQESVFRMYNVITRMSELIDSGELRVGSSTLLRLIDQIIQTTTMPFHGEPAMDLQIMGVLETRNLDFDHILVLSCNEGNLPKGINDSSLIPYSIRKAYELTTRDNKVAIYAYYFYRLMQRCGDVTITYNSSTEDGNTGQMSRFMLQLMVEKSDDTTIHQGNLTAAQSPLKPEQYTIEKDDEVMKVLDSIKYLSPSLINRYLRCPLSFYYNRLAGLSETSADNIADNRLFGTIFHEAAELMYKNIQQPDGTIRHEEIEHLLKEKGHISIGRFVDEAFSEELFHGEKPHYDGLQRISREVVIRFIIKLLKTDMKLGDFKIKGLEQKIYDNIVFDVDGQKRTISIGGSIDRLDQISTRNGDVLRVIDYKTGGKLPKVFGNISEVFDPANVENHSDYYLQAMLYALLVSGNHKEPVQPALLFIQKNESVSNPVLKMGDKNNIEYIHDIREHEAEYRSELTRLLSNIFSKDVPFVATDKPARCERCQYRKLCKG